MLTSLLTSLQEKLFSKSFLLAAVFPIVLFVSANGWLLYKHAPWFGEWLTAFDARDDKAAAYAAMFGLLLAISYVVSMLNATLLEILEGKRAPVRWLAPVLHWWQHWRLRRLEARYDDSARRQLEIAKGQQRWLPSLNAAATAGGALATCDPYPRTWFAALKRRDDLAHAYWRVARVTTRRRLNRVVDVADFEAAVAALVPVLQVNSPGLRTAPSRALLRAMKDTIEAMAHSRDKLQSDRVQLHTRRQFSYPGTIDPSPERSTNNLLAPTTLGNIGRTVRSYALTRYQMDLDIFWTRLQNAVQKASADYYAVVQDAKVQLDSLVTLIWLTALFAVIWAPLLWLKYASPRQALIVAILGVVLIAGLYGLACHSYRVFADLMRSCVDLFRFNLIKDLHLPLPFGTDEERRLWLRLGELTGYGEEQSFRYGHDGT